MEDMIEANEAEKGQIIDIYILSENLAAVRVLDVPEDTTEVTKATCRVAFLHLNDEYDPAFKHETELTGDVLVDVLNGTSLEPLPEAVKKLVTEPVRDESMWTPVIEPATIWMPGIGANVLTEAECVIASQTGSSGADVRAVLSAAARSVGSTTLIDSNAARSRARVRAALILAARARISECTWEWVAHRSRFELVGCESETACLVPTFDIAEDGSVSISGWAPGCTEPFAADPSEIIQTTSDDRDALMSDAEVLLLNRSVEAALPGNRLGRDISPVANEGVSRVVDTEALFAPLANDDAPSDALEIAEDGTVRALRPLFVAAGDINDAYLIDSDDRIVSVKPSHNGCWPVATDGEDAATDYRTRLVVEGEHACFISADAKGERRGLMAKAVTVPAATPAPAVEEKKNDSARVEVETGCGYLIAVPVPEDEPAPGISIWLESFDGKAIDQLVLVEDEGGDGPTIVVNDGTSVDDPHEFEVNLYGPSMQSPADKAPENVQRSA